MANRPRGYGLTAEVRMKMQAKYDPDMERQALEWIASVLDDAGMLDETFGSSIPVGPKEFGAKLKDGIILCKLMNVIDQHSKPLKINTNSKMAFKMMENTGNFLERVKAYGVAPTDLFQTVDLYESQNLVQVINCIHALSRKARANGFQGAFIGPAEATENKREFSDETLKQGNTIIGLQMGTTLGANQSGIHYGRRRQIQPANHYK